MDTPTGVWLQNHSSDYSKVIPVISGCAVKRVKFAFRDANHQIISELSIIKLFPFPPTLLKLFIGHWGQQKQAAHIGYMTFFLFIMLLWCSWRITVCFSDQTCLQFERKQLRQARNSTASRWKLL